MIIDIEIDDFKNASYELEILVANAKLLIAKEGVCDGVCNCGTCFLSCASCWKNMCNVINYKAGVKAHKQKGAPFYEHIKQGFRIEYAEAFLKLFDKPLPTKMDLTQ